MKRILSRAVVLALLCSTLTIAGLSAGVSEASAQGSCSGSVDRDIDVAKRNYASNCGQAYNGSSGFHKCSWVTGGWQCEGPGTPNGSTPAPSPADPTPSSANNGICKGNVNANLQNAKQNYASNCGQAYNGSSGFHKCSWVTGGWQCEGPGNNDSTPSSTNTATPAPAPAPTTNDLCVGGHYSSPATAKLHFSYDCGTPFHETSEYRCDWAPRGWTCSGPGGAFLDFDSDVLTTVAIHSDDTGRAAFISVEELDDGLGDVRITHLDIDGETEVVHLTFDHISEDYYVVATREDLNVNLPLSMQHAHNDPKWIEVDPDQSVYHQDPNVPGEEVKFIHVDGREAIYYPNGALVTDPTYAGTFNFVNARPKGEDLPGWVSWAWFGIGHVAVDVIPYKIQVMLGDLPSEPCVGSTCQGNSSRGEGGTDIDRDGDGVPNWEDDFPNDPNRHEADDTGDGPGDAPQTGGNEGATRPGDAGDGLRGPAEDPDDEPTENPHTR